MSTSLKTMFTLLAALMVSLVSTNDASAIVFADVKNDFGNGVNAGDTSATVNPADTFGTGRWDYFQTDTFGPSGSGSLNLLEWDPVNSPDFGGGVPGRYERAGVNHNGGSQFDFPIIADHGGYGFTAAANEILVHPSDSGNSGGGADTKALVRWTAGAGEAGTGIITGSVRRPSGAASGGQLKIFVDGVEQFDSGVLINASANFEVNTTLNEGSVVDFVFDPVNNQHNDDSIFLAATIRDGGADALWKASEYTGGNWIDSVSGIAATPVGAPTANQADGVFFDGIDDAFAVAAADNPIAGLDDFTVTAVFEADGTQGEGGSFRASGVDDGPNRFFAVSHLVGNEQAGAGAGDFGIGLTGTDGDHDQGIRAGVGLQSDVTVFDDTNSPFNDGLDHIVSMVMDADNQVLKLFVDGTLIDTQNITPNTVIDAGFFFGTNGAPAAGDLAFFNGHLVEVAFHQRSLSDDEVLAIHAAGTAMQMNAVPEPTTAMLALLGAAGLVSRRRSRRDVA